MSSRQKLHTQFLRQLLPLLALAYILAAALTAGLYYHEQRSSVQSERNQTDFSIYRSFSKLAAATSNLSDHTGCSASQCTMDF